MTDVKDALRELLNESDGAEASRDFSEKIRDTLAFRRAKTDAVMAKAFPSTHKPKVGGTVADEAGERHTITAAEDGTVVLDDGTTVAVAELAPRPPEKRDPLTREQANAAMNAALRGRDPDAV